MTKELSKDAYGHSAIAVKVRTGQLITRQSLSFRFYTAALPFCHCRPSQPSRARGNKVPAVHVSIYHNTKRDHSAPPLSDTI